jgi:hypothetical protein
MTKVDIAPCGINCSVCSGYQRTKNKCPGCNRTGNKPTYCQTCSIRFCINKKSEKTYCGLCEIYPCKRLKNLYKRYYSKYGVDIYQNLKEINSGGMEEFIKSENEKWQCKKCGNLLCMHKAICSICGDLNPYFIGTRT